MADLKFQNFPDNVPRGGDGDLYSRDTRASESRCARCIADRCRSSIPGWCARSLLVKSPAKRNDSRAEIFIAASSSADRERLHLLSLFATKLSRWLEFWGEKKQMQNAYIDRNSRVCRNVVRMTRRSKVTRMNDDEMLAVTCAI